MTAPTATKVNTCQVTDCAFNEGSACHALAITIDDPSPATCGTYTPASTSGHGGTQATVANVGACKAASCQHNKDLMCTAGEVQVGMQAGKVSCLTYAGR
ncbi:MAG: DUF1540 domain-containing protein [Sumerlaeia bacterium]